MYDVDLLTGTRSLTSWSLLSAEIMSGWRKVGSACPADLSLSGESNTSPVLLKNFKLVDASEFEVPDVYLEEAKPEDLIRLILPIIKLRCEPNISKVLFWDYDESKLLPPKINLEQFCAKPEGKLSPV